MSFRELKDKKGRVDSPGIDNDISDLLKENFGPTNGSERREENQFVEDFD